MSVTTEHLQNAIERVILLPVRVRHRRRARAQRRAREEALRTTRHALGGAQQLKAKNIKTVFNVALYVLVLDDDLAHFTNDLVCAIGERRRTFVAKHEAVLLYEAAEDLPQLLGHDFREAVKALGASDSQIARLNAASKELNAFWQEKRAFLGNIRNVLAAHREHDAVEYLDKLALVKPLEVMQCAAGLSSGLERLVEVLTDLASLTVGIDAVVRDMRRSATSGQAG
jgi:hypothetical protein